MSVPASESGITILPPGSSWASRLGGGAGAVAWTAIASNGARSGTPRVPSPTRISTLSSRSASIRPRASFASSSNRSTLSTSPASSARIAVE